MGGTCTPDNLDPMAVNLETTVTEKARRALHSGYVLYKFTVLNAVMKSGTRPPLRSVRLLDQLRERIRYCHYSLRTEQAYVYWVRAFIRFHGMRYPREMAVAEVEAFLTHLASRRQASPSTHEQALCALRFLYREVLDSTLPWMQDLVRPKTRVRVPVVLSRDEVAQLLTKVAPEHAVFAQLLYGTGLRLIEGLRLRIKDVDFERNVIVVLEGKGGKDRVVMLPASLPSPLDRLPPAPAGTAALPPLAA